MTARGTSNRCLSSHAPRRSTLRSTRVMRSRRQCSLAVLMISSIARRARPSRRAPHSSAYGARLRGRRRTRANRAAMAGSASRLGGFEAKQHFESGLAAAGPRSHVRPSEFRATRARASSDTISMAESSAVPPLVAHFVPARSMACSIVSVVSTPKAMGTPVESDTLATPLRDFAGDVIEVGRRAANHAAERDDGVDFALDARSSSRRAGFRKSRARGRCVTASGVDAVTHERVDRAGDQSDRR